MTIQQRFALMVVCMLMPVTLPSLARGEDPPSSAAVYQATQCDGFYPGHLQGIAVDGEGAIFWSFTTRLVRSDSHGKVVAAIDVANHHGDLTFVDGKLYVAVNFGDFNNPQGKADSWVYVYRANDLSLVSKHEVQEVVYGAGGIAHRQGRFIVVGGLPGDKTENYAYEYDNDFRFLRRHVVASGHTQLGIQTAEYADGRWWFGCYGSPSQLIVADESFAFTGRFDFNCSYGIAAIAEGKFLVTSGANIPGKGRTGAVHVAVADKEQGLKVLIAD